MVDQEEKQFINEVCQESSIGLVERLRAENAALQELLNIKDQLIADMTIAEIRSAGSRAQPIRRLTRRGPKTTITTQMVEDIKTMKRDGATWEDVSERFGYHASYLKDFVGPQRNWDPHCTSAKG